MLLLVQVLVPACGSSSDGGTTTPSDGSQGDGQDSDGASGDGASGDGAGGDGAGGDGAGGDGAGGDGSGDEYVQHDVSANDFCQELTTLVCKADQVCCTDASARHDTVDACVAAKIGDCQRDVESIASDPKTGYSASTAGARLFALHEQLATCDLDIGEWFVNRSGLLGVFEGTVAPGGDCTPANQDDRATVLSCASGSVCRISIVGLGGPSGECGSEASERESCVTELECTEGLRCNPPQALGGTCQARLADGASCSENGDCSSLVCEGQRCVARSVQSVYCFK